MQTEPARYSAEAGGIAMAIERSGYRPSVLSNKLEWSCSMQHSRHASRVWHHHCGLLIVMHSARSAMSSLYYELYGDRREIQADRRSLRVGKCETGGCLARPRVKIESNRGRPNVDLQIAERGDECGTLG